MTDCAKYLNGRGIGARYDGSFPGSSHVGSCSGLTGSAASFSQSYKTFLRQAWEAQVGLGLQSCCTYTCADLRAQYCSGYHVREGERVDPMDVEDGRCGRMVV